MKYQIEIWKISEFIELLKRDKVDLSPPYQRNFIWSPKDQRLLIDTILIGLPLPSFFLCEKSKDEYEMVDGQQRSRTILRFFQGHISDSKKEFYNDIDKKDFLDYELSIIIITDLSENDSLERFYSLVNKTGKHLNIPELFKAQYHDKYFLTLNENLLNYQDFIDLDLFSDASSKRMNDRSFIEELVAFIKVGITDKKDIIEKIYEQDITQQLYEDLEAQFINVINRIKRLNEFHPIKNTRYKQKNDFYTLFNYIHLNKSLSDNLLLENYNLLISIQRFISPSNEDCKAFKDYAINCVSQSNSKKARESRLLFFTELLLNKNPSGNDTINIILDYFDEMCTDCVHLKKVEDYYLINSSEINSMPENA